MFHTIFHHCKVRNKFFMQLFRWMFWYCSNTFYLVLNLLIIKGRFNVLMIANTGGLGGWPHVPPRILGIFIFKRNEKKEIITQSLTSSFIHFSRRSKLQHPPSLSTLILSKIALASTPVTRQSLQVLSVSPNPRANLSH